MLQYLLDCLHPLDDETVYIPYVKPLDIRGLLLVKFGTIYIHDDLGNLLDVIRGNGKGICRYIELSIPSRGTAETLHIATSIMDLKLPLVSFDCDNFYPGDVLSRLRWLKDSWGICYFEDTQSNPIYSYIEGTEIVTHIAEKVKISDMACSGIYYFGSTGEAREISANVLRESLSDGKEVYISFIYRKAIERGIRIKPVLEPPISLGTPMAVESFAKKAKGESKIFCFDLDGTLVTSGVDYTKVKPIKETVEFVRYLKSEGHTVIIHTARGMLSRNGNVEKIQAEVLPQIEKTLRDFDIPYDQLIIGKPYADFYIDDKAISTFSSLQKETGMYNKMVSPNETHTLRTEDKYVVKQGELSGEKWWYDHIPPRIANLFPSINDEKSTNRELWVEKIEGLTFSEKYIAGSLTAGHLRTLINALELVHSHEPSTPPASIQSNYIDKLEERYPAISDVMSATHQQKELYTRLLTGLKSYAEQVITPCAIHGDPVFTNVFLTPTNTIMFIDMRGKLGKELTIYGDPNYDFAKVYQSLTGYDFILHQHRPTSSSHQSEMIALFEKSMGLAKMKWIYLLTASLYFTLIPLHRTESISQIYEYFKMTERLLDKYELYA